MKICIQKAVGLLAALAACGAGVGYADYPSVNHGVIFKMEAVRIINIGPASLAMSFSNQDWTAGEAFSAYKYAGGTLSYSTNSPSVIKASVSGVPTQIEKLELRVCVATSGPCQTASGAKQDVQTDYVDVRNKSNVEVLPRSNFPTLFGPGGNNAVMGDGSGTADYRGNFNLLYRAQANLKGMGSGSATVMYTIVTP